MSAQDFSQKQHRYLEVFVSGVQARRASQGLKRLGAEGGAGPPTGPDRAHLAAMVHVEALGKKLPAEEKTKRDQHPFDAYARLSESAKGQFATGLDNFRWRVQALLYVALAQNSLQSGEAMPGHAIPLIEALMELGILTKARGADNIGNVTSPTAGIDPQERLYTRDARTWHHHSLNGGSLSGLPRKFNVGCDGGGATPVLEDANDIGFTALRARDMEPALIDRSAKGAPMSQAAARDFMAELKVVGHAQADVY